MKSGLSSKNTNAYTKPIPGQFGPVNFARLLQLAQNCAVLDSHASTKLPVKAFNCKSF